MRLLPIIVFLAVIQPQLWGAKHAGWGERDFIQYWAGCNALTHGANPYDANAIKAIQSGVRPEIALPVMSWNPPWALGALCPLLSTDNYETSVRRWIAINIFCWLGSAFLYSFILVLSPHWQSPPSAITSL